MANAPLRLAEVLEDEFHYFYGEVPLRAATIDSKHIRELPPLVEKLKAIQQQRGTGLPGCARLLASRCDFRDAHDVESECRVVEDALREMLTETGLLHQLLDDRSLAETLTTPDALRKLLRIPQARRLLLDEPATAKAILADDGLVDVFTCESTALRLLLNEGFRTSIDVYPPLLATIADSNELNAVLAGTTDETRVEAGRRRQQLIYFFRTEAAAGGFQRLLSRVSLLKSQDSDSKAKPDLMLVATNAQALLNLVDAIELPRDFAKNVVPDDVAPDSLSHFNLLLLEYAFPEHLADGSDLRTLYSSMHERDTTALCLSGGGIRSATFNLGVLQGLADHNLLTRFHYLSTVSGGGYIGSWLSSYVRRHPEGLWGTAKDLSAKPADPAEPEVKTISHLREYSSYLAPKAAALSTDTWTLVATYLRNLLLNWTMLIPALAAALAVPRLVEAVAHHFARTVDLATLPAFAMMLFGFFATLGVALVRPASDRVAGKPLTKKEMRRRRLSFWLWLAPLILASIEFTIYWSSLHMAPRVPANFPWDAFVLADGLDHVGKWTFPALFAGGNAVAALIYSSRRGFNAYGGSGNWLQRRLRSVLAVLTKDGAAGRTWAEIVAAAVSGFVAGWLLCTIFNNVFPPHSLAQTDGKLLFEIFICVSIPMFLIAFFLQASLLVGFTTGYSFDHDREWWARSAAMIFVCAIVYVALALCVIVMPILLAQIPEFLAPAGGVSAAVAWFFAKAARAAKKDEKADKPPAWHGLVLTLAALVTTIFIVALISLGTTDLIALNHDGWRDRIHVDAILGLKASTASLRHLYVVQHSHWDELLLFIAGSALIASIMSRLLDVNVYSMHGMYRNRLMRAYLGASRWTRRPDPFTGFDGRDNLRMWELRPETLWVTSFISFDAFAAQLGNDPLLTAQLPREMVARVRTFNSGTNMSAEQRDELQTDLVDAINRLMLVRDIENNVGAPRTLELYAANRRFLDQRYAGTIMPCAPDEQPAQAATSSTAAHHSGGDAEHDAHLVAAFDDDRADLPNRRRAPLHIVNMALNLVGGENLAWQERKADSFTVSALHAGNRRLGYRDSSTYGEGISLGTALAISGAAVSPNMGYNSSPIVTFLMTLFNARLGWWLGNPGDSGSSTYQLSGPRSTIASILDEALGRTNDTSPYVFLSDGGHFDNLGLYEMVLRRCRYIVVSDASADRRYAFGDLANAVRKIRIDLGIPIDLRTTYIGPQEGEKLGRYCALGLIRYGDVDDIPSGKDPYGRLIYIKPAVYEDCPPDVRNYQKESDGFPHESTADQFFSESQFESYRALGRHIVGQIARGSGHAPNVRAFFKNAKDYVYAET